MGTTVELRLPEPITDDVVVSTCEALRTRLCAGGVSHVVCHLERGAGDLALERGAGDLAAVDALARLALTARRAGVAFGLAAADPDLLGLLRLVGLADALLGPADG